MTSLRCVILTRWPVRITIYSILFYTKARSAHNTGRACQYVDCLPSWLAHLPTQPRVDRIVRLGTWFILGQPCQNRRLQLERGVVIRVVYASERDDSPDDGA